MVIVGADGPWVQAPGIDAIGAGFAGVPGVVLGHNAQVALIQIISPHWLLGYNVQESLKCDYHYME